MTLPTSDSFLISAWRQGDQEAFASLVARYHGLVLGACRRQAPPGEADDAAQAVFLVLARRPAAAARCPALAAWLLRVTELVCRSARRSALRRRRTETAALPADQAPAGRPSGGEALDLLDACLLALPDGQRAAVSLHFMAGLDPAEVAQRLGTSREAAYKLIARGLEALRRQFSRRGIIMPGAAVGVLLAGQAAQATAAEALAGMLVRQPSVHAELLADAGAAGLGTPIGGLAAMAAGILAVATVGAATLTAAAAGDGAPPPPPPAVAPEPLPILDAAAAAALPADERQAPPGSVAPAYLLSPEAETVVLARLLDYDRLQLNGLRHLQSGDIATVIATMNSMVGFWGGGDLAGVASMSDDAAAGLALNPSGLRLPGLRMLSVDQAAILARNPKVLDLGLRQAEPAVLAALARCTGRLALDLEQLDAATARLLAARSGDLKLPRIARLAPDVAAALVACRGRLELPGLEELSDPRLAERIASAWPWPANASLDLPRLRRLTDPRIARALAACPETIDLSGLDELGTEAAVALVERTVVPAGTYSRSGLAVGLTSLDPALATILARNPGSLAFSRLERLDPAVAEALASHRGRLSFERLASLTPDAAQALARRGEAWLSLPALNRMDAATARALAGCRGPLHLEGLVDPEPAAQSALAAAPRIHVGRALRRLDAPELAAVLASPTAVRAAETIAAIASLSPAAAAVLVERWPGTLALSGLAGCPPELAEVLARHPGDLDLRGLKSLSDAAWSRLAQRRALTDLSGLAEISPARLAQAAAAGAAFRLPGMRISVLPDAAAAAMVAGVDAGGAPVRDAAQRSLTSLELAIESLGAAEAAALAASTRRLSLRQLKGLDADAARALVTRPHVDSGNTVTIGSEAADSAAVWRILLDGDARIELDGGQPPPPSLAEALRDADGGTLAIRRLSEPLVPALMGFHGEIIVRDIAPMLFNPADGVRLMDDGSVGMSAAGRQAALAWGYLVEGRGPLVLGGVRRLTETQERILARRLGDIALPDLEEVATRVLADRLLAGGRSRMHALRRASREAEDALAAAGFVPARLERLVLPALAQRLLQDDRRSDGWPAIRRLNELSPAAARVLTARVADLQLPRLAGLDPDLASALASGTGTLALRGIRRLDRDTAMALARHPGRLELGGLREIPPDLATALASSRGTLALGGVRKLSRASAEALAATPGGLELPGLDGEDATVITALASTRGRLALDGVRRLPPQLAASLAAGMRPLVLGLDDLDVATATALAVHRGELALPQLTAVADADALRVLAGKPGSLSVGLTRLTPAIAEAIASHGGALALPRLRSLPADIAAALATCRGDLALDGLISLDAAAARALSAHRGRLTMHLLTAIDDETAAHLAAKPGTLGLRGLKTPPAALRDRLREPESAPSPPQAEPAREPVF